jgi:hypothetical protein
MNHQREINPPTGPCDSLRREPWPHRNVPVRSSALNVRHRARIGAPINVGIEHQLIDLWVHYPVPL